MAIRKPFAVLPLKLVDPVGGSADPNRPWTHLALPQYPAMRWESDDDERLWVRGRFDGVQPVDFVSLMAANAQPDTTIRVRLGTTQAEVDGTAPYDSGAQFFPAPANANRVPFSRMEGDRGFTTTFNPSGLAATTSYGSFENRRFFVASVTATASGQNYSIGSNVPIRVTAGERLSVQAKLDVFNPAAIGGNWAFRAVFFNAAGVATFLPIATGNGPISAATITSGFIDVPAGQVSMILELVAISGTAGTWQIAISEPMVTSAAPGQTVHPAFTPTPNFSEDDEALVHSHLELPEVVNASWWRIDIEGHAGDFSASTLVMGLKREPAYFYNRDREFGFEDLGQFEIARNGVVADTPGVVLRTLLFRLGWVSEAEFFDKWADLGERNADGSKRVIYWCFDPEATARRQAKTYLGFMARDIFNRGNDVGTFSTMDFQFRAVM